MFFAEKSHLVFEIHQFANNLQRWHVAKREVSFQLISDCCLRKPVGLIRWKLPSYGFFLTRITNVLRRPICLFIPSLCAQFYQSQLWLIATKHTSVPLLTLALSSTSEYFMVSPNSSFDGDPELQMYVRVNQIVMY